MGQTQPENTKDLIRAHGLRVTPGRVAVYEALMGIKTPLSHNEVVERLEGSTVDRVTVYRNLNDLANAGLLRRSDLGDHVWRFEIPHADAHDNGHPHFICTECGDVQCLDGVELQVPRSRMLPRSLRKKAIEVNVRGLCNSCD